MAKWVYKFEEGNASMRNLLGGKGCNLAEMTILGMPIPQALLLRQRPAPITTTAASRSQRRSRTRSSRLLHG